MTLPSILAVTFLGSAAANTVHWRGRDGERFLYQANSGLLRVVFGVWMIATAVSAILFLLDALPRQVFLVVAVAMSSAQMLYSIARRQQERGVPK